MAQPKVALFLEAQPNATKGGWGIINVNIRLV